MSSRTTCGRRYVGTDLFQLKGVTYLLMVDYFSHYPEIHKLKTISSSEVIKLTKATFSRFGIQEVVFSYNGPQYASQEFKHFGRSYEFQHVTSSPHYPQSNGQAEMTVKTIKQLLSSLRRPGLGAAYLQVYSISLVWPLASRTPNGVTCQVKHPTSKQPACTSLGLPWEVQGGQHTL